MAIATLNPATGEVLKTFAPLSDTELEAKLAAAATTFLSYRQTTFAQRATWLRAAAAILERDRDAYAKLMTLEMGKPLKAAIAEVDKCALVCRFYADQAAVMLADVPIATDASRSFVCYQPLGVILAVMPWNFPFWQVFRFAAPALMAGNVGLLKHASNVPQCALAIADILAEAGFPAGAFQTLLIEAKRVAPLMADDRIKAATLTGSEPAGASLAQAAGQNLKKTVLELGGSDPFIVMPSADLEAAVATAVTARMINTGQSCIAAKRFIVAEAIADEFEQRLLEKYRALKVGDPMLPETDLGPLATGGIVADLDRLVQACLQQGATALCGGQPYAQSDPDSPLAKGHFYPPTILTNLPVGCPAYDEEFFGPVALLFRVPDLDAAIGLANCSPYGLGASAWTQVPAEAERFLRELEAGSVFINGMVKSDPRLPFGGIKRSGYGRELSREGILEFVNTKTVWIQ
ncbi:NAD-dependent succinate-semialdehyde dehydrogenase [Trichothermofontia sp.]